MSFLKYAVGDPGKCNWGSGQYVVKVVEVNPSRKSAPYLVHYQGWKSRWDEWVPEARVSGPGTGHKNKIFLPSPTRKTATGKGKANVARETVNKAEPELMRILDGSKIVYIKQVAGMKEFDDNSKFRSLAEIRRYCSQQNLNFEASKYDFSVPSSAVSAMSKSTGKKARKSISGGQTRSSPTKGNRGTPGKQSTKAARQKSELDSDLREIQRGLSPGTGRSRKTDSRPTIQQQSTPNVIVQPIGDFYCAIPSIPEDSRPSRRQKRPNQKYTDFLGETGQAKRSRGGAFPQERPVMGAPSYSGDLVSYGGKRAGNAKKSASKPKSPARGSKSRAKSKAGTKKKAAPAVHYSTHIDIHPHPPYEVVDESGASVSLTGMMMPDLDPEETTEFIEIQAPEPMVSDVPKDRIERVRGRRSGAGGRKVPVDKKMGVTLHIQHQQEDQRRYEDVEFGMNPAVGELGGFDDNFGCFFDNANMEPADVHVHHQSQDPHIQEALRGIKVTGNPPAVQAPSRVIMKLKGPTGPDTGRKPSSRYGTRNIPPSIRMGGDAIEYIDPNLGYTPPVNVGGRGHFGVVGSGQPLPQPVIQEKRDHFCILPQEIVGDHCYGKSPPPVGGTNLSPIGPALYGSVGRGQGRRIQLGSSTFAQNLAAADAEFYDEDELEGLADYDGMEVVGFAESPGPSGGEGLGFGGSQRHTPMLSDKLPVNILEGVDDGDLGDHPSMGIH